MSNIEMWRSVRGGSRRGGMSESDEMPRSGSVVHVKSRLEISLRSLDYVGLVGFANRIEPLRYE